MRNKTINNRLHEDLLDDMEARSTSVSKRIVDDADENSVRHDVDDATYFDYTFFIESSDMEKYRIDIKNPDEAIETMKKLNDDIYYICQRTRAIEDWSDIVFYAVPSDYREFFEGKYRSPYIIDSNTTGYLCSNRYRFSIKSHFTNIREVFRFLMIIWHAFAKPATLFFVEFVASQMDKWAWQEDEDEPISTNVNVDLHDLSCFINNDKFWNINISPKISQACYFVQTTFAIANVFFPNSKELIKQFDRIYTFRFNEPFRLRLMNNEPNTILNYQICRNVFSEEGSKIKEKLLSAKMTFKKFVLEKKNRPNIEPRYIVESMWPRHLENKTMLCPMNGSKDIYTEQFFDKEFYFNNFRCFVDKSRGRLYFYVYLGPIVEEEMKCVLLMLDVLLIKTSEPNNNINISQSRDLLEFVNALFDDCLTEEDIDDAVKEVCFTISENTTYR